MLSNLVKGKLKGPGSAAVIAAAQDCPKLLPCPFELMEPNAASVSERVSLATLFTSSSLIGSQTLNTSEMPNICSEC